MNLAPVGEHALDIVERLRTLRVPCQFRLLPGRLQVLHFLPENVNTLMKLCQLALRLVILPSRGLDQRHLALDLLQFLLRLIAGFHV